jgi:hypothetical protein
MKTDSKSPGIMSSQLQEDKVLRDKAKEFRKEQIFQIVNEYQKSMQMIDMVLTIDEINNFFESVSALMMKKAHQQEQLSKIRSLLIALDNLNSRQINAKMFRDN